MTNDPRDIVDQAIEWLIREPAMGPDDWADFIAWLEASPAHARAYDRVATTAHALPSDVGAVVPAAVRMAPAANDDVATPTVLRRPWLLPVGGAAIAASIALLVAPAVVETASTLEIITTAPGHTQTVALDDGTMIEINGGSSLQIDRKDARRASLIAGEATFRVRHDAARPFEVRTGEMVVRDVGTVFNVARDGRRVDVEVAEGEVLFQPHGQAVRLTAGAGLRAVDGQPQVTRLNVLADDVGGWRTGRMRFRYETVNHLADAVHRRYGTDIVVAPALAKQSFTGVVTFTGDAKQDVPHIAALIGARWQQDGARWTLSPEQRVQD